MRKFSSYIRFFVLLLLSCSHWTAPLPVGAERETGEIAVIVNPENKIEQMTSREISDIYLARRRTFPSGDPVVVLEQTWKGKRREAFFRLLNGMSLKRLNSYWVRLQFSGNVQPPPTLDDDLAVRKTVSENPHALGYISSENVDDSVRVILTLTPR